MNNYQGCLLEESKQLSIKLNELELFCKSEKFKTLSLIDSCLLSAQFDAMKAYDAILKLRIQFL